MQIFDLVFTSLLEKNWYLHLTPSLGWRYRSPKSPLAIKNCSWRVKTPEEQILAIKKIVINKIADHEFRIVFGHFTLQSSQINSLQTLSPRATGHIYLRYTINTCVRSSFDTPIIMYHEWLWLRFNSNYISKSGYQSVGLVFTTSNVFTALVCKEH